jgi:hypothetical protein
MLTAEGGRRQGGLMVGKKRCMTGLSVSSADGEDIWRPLVNLPGCAWAVGDSVTKGTRVDF